MANIATLQDAAFHGANKRAKIGTPNHPEYTQIGLPGDLNLNVRRVEVGIVPDPANPGRYQVVKYTDLQNRYISLPNPNNGNQPYTDVEMVKVFLSEKNIARINNGANPPVVTHPYAVIKVVNQNATLKGVLVNPAVQPLPPVVNQVIALQRDIQALQAAINALVVPAPAPAAVTLGQLQDEINLLGRAVMNAIKDGNPAPIRAVVPAAPAPAASSYAIVRLYTAIVDRIKSLLSALRNGLVSCMEWAKIIAKLVAALVLAAAIGLTALEAYQFFFNRHGFDKDMAGAQEMLASLANMTASLLGNVTEGVVNFASNNIATLFASNNMTAVNETVAQ